VRVRPEREVRQFAALAGTGLGDFLPAVPDLADEQPGQAVQVAPAMLVIDVLSGPAHDHGDFTAGVRGHPGEVQPQVAMGSILECLPGEAAGAIPGALGAVRSGHLVPQP
jgi:hypothetical protein